MASCHYRLANPPEQPQKWTIEFYHCIAPAEGYRTVNIAYDSAKEVLDFAHKAISAESFPHTEQCTMRHLNRVNMFD